MKPEPAPAEPGIVPANGKPIGAANGGAEAPVVEEGTAEETPPPP
jgi:hypothetical protein